MKKLYLVFVSLFFANFLMAQQTKILEIIANKPYCEVQPTMWGIFFEDINFAADGGIYSQLVKNGSFEFYKPLMGWREIKTSSSNGSLLIINYRDERPNNPRIVRITSSCDTCIFGLTNEGYRGIGVRENEAYNFSIFARKVDDGNVTLKVELISSMGEIIGESSISGFDSDWKKYETSFVSKKTDAKAKLNVYIYGKGTLDIDMVSLFPSNTWKGRKNGLRKDLVQMLVDLKPGFLRFPGGCIVEGHELETRYQWKNTIGPLENRKLIINRWNTEMRNRQTPDYFQSFGLGFYEYFLLAEDLNAEPLPVINCGMACQFNTGEVVPLEQLDPYVQDALDLIEFANGPVDSKWGKIRAELGHPEPFNLKYIGVGNEQWGPQYIERYKIFAEKIKEKYPNIKIVAAAGPYPDGDRFEYLWRELRKLNADFVDEHYYKNPEWFLSNATRYDNYDRKGPKVFAGEYACHTKEDKPAESRNNWLSALAEAAFMTGLERNADIVYMCSYAPLFAHVEAWQWRPNLIWFDNLNVIATPNYYVQKIFSNHKGTHVVPAVANNKPLTGQDSIYASATIDKNKNELYIKIVNVSSTAHKYNIFVKGTTLSSNNVNLIELFSNDLYSYNSIEKPNVIVPKEKIIKAKVNNISLTLQPRSVNLLKLKCKKL